MEAGQVSGDRGAPAELPPREVVLSLEKMVETIGAPTWRRTMTSGWPTSMPAEIFRPGAAERHQAHERAPKGVRANMKRTFNGDLTEEERVRVVLQAAAL